MKTRLYSLISLCLVFVLLVSLPASAGAAGQEDDPVQTTEITVKAAEIKAKGAYKAIQSALNSARYGATKDNVYKITVEAGSYSLRSALHLYSNTTLSLYNVTLTRSKESICNMIRTGDDTAVNKGPTGYSPNANITLEGGVLDGGATANTMVKVTHASDFRMIGTELINVKNAHMMEVAAVDGFLVKNCSFKNQVMETGTVGYEAIQLDIPKSSHIFGCRSEVLANRGVRIEGCFFTNCPRAVGSHTQILNLPMDDIVITNNTFKDLKSVAIQAENWTNCQITDNRITGTPRAIALYSVLGNGNCAFRAGVIAKEGATETVISDKYQTPPKANILIANNSIQDCGTVKDVYASYKPLAILLMGQKITKQAKPFSDGAGAYPKGDYYIDGVTIQNNEITTAGHGIFLQDVRNADISGNTIHCQKTDLLSGGYNPITTLQSTVTAISDNTVTAAPYHGMELASTTVGSIRSNSLTGVKGDGILLEAVSKVTGAVAENYIGKAGGYGLHIRPKCSAGSVSGNIISGCGKGAIQQDKTAVATIGDNYYKVADMRSLNLDYTKVTLGTEESFTLTPTYAPANAVPDLSWNSSDGTIAGVSQKGVVTAYSCGEADITVKSAGGKKATCHIKVLPPPDSIKLNANLLTIGTGETFDLDSKLPEGTFAQSIVYRSNNTGAVKVDRHGKLKGVGTGTATVVAETYNGKHACCNIIVKESPYDVWFDTGELSLGVGEISTLCLELPEGSAAHAVTWHCDNEKVLSVGSNGELHAKEAGEATVTASVFNGATAICRVNVMREPTEAAFAESEYALAVGETLTPDVVFSENTTSHALSFQSSDPDICHVNRTTGELTAKKAGTVTLTVKTYNRLSATCTVTVTGESTS